MSAASLLLLFCLAGPYLGPAVAGNVTNTTNGTASPTCTSGLFQNGTDQLYCQLANSYCPDQGYINYLQLYYCNGHAWVLVVMCFLLAILLYNLGEVADSHFCPCLERLSDGLRLSPTVAGPTLLALGNGAPDISTSLVATLSGEGAEVLGVVTPLGSGVFITAVVLALVTWSSKWRVAPGVIARDVGFYMLAVVSLWIILADGKLWLFEGILLLLLYAVYVTVVIFTDKWLVLRPDPADPPAELTSIPAATEEDREVPVEPLVPDDSEPGTLVTCVVGDMMTEDVLSPRATHSPAGSFTHRRRSLPRVRSAPVLGTLAADRDAKKRSASAGHFRGPSSSLIAAPAPNSPPFHVPVLPPELLFSSSTSGQPLEAGPLESVRRSMFRYYFSRYRRAARHNLLYRNTAAGTAVQPPTEPEPPAEPQSYVADWHQLWAALGWANKNWLQRFATLLQLPFKAAYLANIPPATDAEWNKLRAVVCPIFAPPLCLLAFLCFQPAAYGIAVGVGLSVAATIHCLTEHETAPRWSMLLTVMAFGMSILWIYVIANEVVNLLQCLGTILGLSQSTLAVTVLAFGNCIGDAAADTAVARHGLGGMAISAVYGGPLLPLLTSLGVAFTYNAARKYPEPYVMGKMSADATFTLWALALSLLLGFTVLLITRFRSHYLGGLAHFLFYATFLTVLLLYEFNVISMTWLPFPDTYCDKTRNYFGTTDTSVCRV
eukprot:EG_transcript_2968